MSVLLLIVIYIAFIGLGIPDSLFGTAWPAIYSEFQIPVSWANFVTMIVSGGTVISSLFAARLIRRFGTAAITAVSTTMTALALLGFSMSGSMLWFCLFAIPLGLGAGSIDTALNDYVAMHYKAVHMNFLHCFYGIGVSLSPFLMSLALSKGSWQSGYRSVFWFQLGIALLTILSLPVWKKVRHKAQAAEEEAGKVVGFFPLIRQSRVRMACCVFIGSCGIEYTCGIWGSTFLVKAKGMDVDAAALMITCYYVGIAFGRFLSGVLANKVSSPRLIRIGQTATLAAIALLLFPVPSPVAAAGLFLVGTGNGPVFPNMLHLTPRYFGIELSRSAMGVQMAFSYVGIMLVPALFGLLAQNVSAALFPWYLLICYGIMIFGTLGISRSPKLRIEA